MVDSKYGMYLESIDSAPELASSKYKKSPFNKDNFFDELVPYFYNGLPTDTAFTIKYDNDNDNMSNKFSKQYDDLYQMGARNIIDNKNYVEEFECFAPLYVSKSGIPSGFIVFRVDGPGLLSMSKDNFRMEILDKFKCVKFFDLSKKTPIGEWMDNNFISNKNFPATPFELDYKRLEFSKWNGINYDTGGYTYKSFFLDETLEKGNPLFDLDKFVFDGYRNNKVVFPSILNLSFLFDDTPATPISLRKWSINRYFGFYIDDMELYDAVTPHVLHELKSDISISTGNVISSVSGNPFVEDWKDALVYYVEYGGNLYKVEKFTETQPTTIGASRISNSLVIIDEPVQLEVTKYRIISDIDLTGKESLLNNKIVYINESNSLVKLDGSDYQIDGFESADIWIIEIDGVYHKLVKDGTKLKVYTDYAFKFPVDRYIYWVNESDSSYSKTVSLVIDSNNPPKNFKIYRLELTDIKDFDTSIVDTEYSKFEYENKEDLTVTDETKMYTVDLRSNSNPKDLNDYNYKDKVVNIPVSSEYTADYETFRIVDKGLTELWRKNATYCRWVYQDSLSANDYPYLMNNSVLFEDFNRSVNPFDPDPKRIERNLDYFYTINAGTTSYIHHTLHVENNTGGVPDNAFSFEFDKYLNTGTYSGGTYSFDYFSYFFDRKTTFDNGSITKGVRKYSLLNIGDNIIPNTTVFRGLKFRIYDVETIKVNQGVIDNINLKNSNAFEDYKFSILLSDNKSHITPTTCYSFETLSPGKIFINFTIYFSSTDDIHVGDIAEITSACKFPDGTIYPILIGTVTPYGSSTIVTLVDSIGADVALIANCSGTICITNMSLTTVNTMQWDIIENWEMDKTYASGSVVLLDDILYKATQDSLIDVPVVTVSGVQVKSAPYNDQNWMTYTYSYGIVNTSNSGTPFWNPNYDTLYTTLTDVVYNNSEYYYCYDSGSTNSFWNPNITYSNGDMVFFKGEYYTSNVSSNIFPPNIGIQFRGTSTWQNYWEPSESNTPKWLPIDLWNPSITYTVQYVIHNNIVYYGDGSTGDEPGISSGWVRVYSISQDTSYVYATGSNPFVGINNKIYMIESNDIGSTLENGINIYINKKWKNIFINIFINDNTTPYLSGADRDLLYSDLNKKLTANNFIHCINDVSNKFGFSDYLNYVVIDESGVATTYNIDNISDLKYMLFCETPDELFTKIKSIKYNPISVGKNILKVVNMLRDGKIINTSSLNYYNDIPFGVDISFDKDDSNVVTTYHGMTNITENQIYRHSGYYMPLFYNVELFTKPGLTSSPIGNYKFDTSYNNFGVIKQRVISKVNRNGNVLKLRDNNSYKSMYPMIDEFGYTYTDFFIFKSTWDYEYHIECNKVDILNTNNSVNNGSTDRSVPQIINTNTNLSL